MDLSECSSGNTLATPRNPNRYFSVDCFSRMFAARTIKSKRAVEVVKRMEEIIEELGAPNMAFFPQSIIFILFVYLS